MLTVNLRLFQDCLFGLLQSQLRNGLKVLELSLLQRIQLCLRSLQTLLPIAEPVLPILQGVRSAVQVLFSLGQTALLPLQVAPLLAKVLLRAGAQPQGLLFCLQQSSLLLLLCLLLDANGLGLSLRQAPSAQHPPVEDANHGPHSQGR